MLKRNEPPVLISKFAMEASPWSLVVSFSVQVGEEMIEEDWKNFTDEIHPDRSKTKFDNPMLFIAGNLKFII